jgi:hypothetical protein
MGDSVAGGKRGEDTARVLLGYRGWMIVEVQPLSKAGHRFDVAAQDPDGVEWLVEVKVWENPTSGTDTVKKAIADADDSRRAGEPRPILVILSKELGGLHGEMLRRATEAGVINRVEMFDLRTLFEAPDDADD